MKNLLIKIIKFYQREISPCKDTKPWCRFVPSCSEYAIEAIEKFGVFKGVALSLFRFSRCNPLFRGGYDPVPQKRKK